MILALPVECLGHRHHGSTVADIHTHVRCRPPGKFNEFLLRGLPLNRFCDNATLLLSVFRKSCRLAFANRLLFALGIEVPVLVAPVTVVGRPPECADAFGSAMAEIFTEPLKVLRGNAINEFIEFLCIGELSFFRFFLLRPAFPVERNVALHGGKLPVILEREPNALLPLLSNELKRFVVLLAIHGSPDEEEIGTLGLKVLEPKFHLFHRRKLFVVVEREEHAPFRKRHATDALEFLGLCGGFLIPLYNLHFPVEALREVCRNDAPVFYKRIFSIEHILREPSLFPIRIERRSCVREEGPGLCAESVCLITLLLHFREVDEAFIEMHPEKCPCFHKHRTDAGKSRILPQSPKLNRLAPPGANELLQSSLPCSFEECFDLLGTRPGLEYPLEPCPDLLPVQCWLRRFRRVFQ